MKFLIPLKLYYLQWALAYVEWQLQRQQDKYERASRAKAAAVVAVERLNFELDAIETELNIFGGRA